MNVRIFIISLVSSFVAALGASALVKLPSISVETPGYVTCVGFDRVGMLWIGTSEGLVKYDGYGSTTYSSNIDNPNFLPNDYVRCLTASSGSVLWVGTNDGLVRIDLSLGHTKHYHLKRGTQRIIYTLFTSRDGTVYAGTDGGLVRYMAAEDRWEDVPDCQFSVKDIVEDGEGNLLIGTWADGLRVRSSDGKRVWRVGQAGTNVFALCLDADGRLWIGSWHGGIGVVEHPANPGKTRVRFFPQTTGRRIFRMRFDPQTRQIWACSNRSVVVIEPETVMERGGEAIRYIESGERSDFSSIDTNGRGLVVASSNWGDMSAWRTEEPLISSFQVDSLCPVSAVFTTDDNHFLAISNNNGGNTFELDRNGDRPCWYGTDWFGTLSSCHAIVRRANGDIWIGSYYEGALIMHCDGTVSKLNVRNTPELKENSVASMYAEADGTVWMGHWSGVTRVSPINAVSVVRLADYVDNFYKSKVRDIMADKRRNVWITTYSNGILRLNADFKGDADIKVRQYTYTNGMLPLREATACVEDKHGRIWAISSVGGLMRYDNEGDRFVSVGDELGVYEDGIVAAGVDNDGNLWMAATDHLVCLTFKDVKFDSKTDTEVLRFSYPHGVGRIMPQENSAFITQRYFYFTTQDGFIRFNPRELLKSRTMEAQCPLILTDIYIDGRHISEVDSTLRQRICGGILPPYTASVTLPHSVGRFAVSFAALGYDGNHGRYYAYLLEGYDKERTTCTGGTVPNATYENLPAGNYRLRLWVTDDTGQWREAPCALSVCVLPPWWQTWWAYTLWLLMAVAVVWAAVEWQRRRIRTLNRLRIANVFTNITHEFLTPLSIISASIDLSRTNIPGTDYLSIKTNIERLKRLIRQVLEVEKVANERQRISVSQNNLGHFIGSLCDNMRVLANQKCITLEYQSQSEFAEAYFDTDKLDTVIYNLLSNAIKYTEEGGRVIVTLQQADDGRTARIVVADTGIGIDSSHLRHLYSRFMDGDYRRMKTMGTGIGLSLTRDLVTLHHGTIECESKPGVGTTFTVEIPTTRDSYPMVTFQSIVVGDGMTYDKHHQSTIRVGEKQELGGKSADNANCNSANDKCTILVVEDNVELLNLMRQTLSARYNVFTAKNGQQALNVISRKPLDIVVTDVMMPVMDGIELTRNIKSNPDTAGLPVVMLTAKTRDEDRNEAFRIGADEYLTKPFGMDGLQLRIDNILANRERIRRQFMRQTDFKIDQQAYSDPDAVFMQKAVDCVKRHLADSGYDRDAFAADMCMSASTLYKKLRALTGQNVSAFVNSIRLKEACRIARTNPHVQVCDLYVRLGYNSSGYFSRLFKAEFGMTFTEYQEKVKQS